MKATPSIVDSLGQRLRRARRLRGKTLREVAEAAGLSVGFVSQAERDLTGVSLSSLANLARVLAVPLRELVDQPPAGGADTHRGQRARYRLKDRGQSYERLSTSFPGSVLNAVKMTLPVGYCSEFVAHAGDEFVYVLRGKARYTLGERHFELRAGDSLHFDGRQKHCVANADKQTTELVSIGTLNLFDDPRPKRAGRKKKRTPRD